MAALGKVLLLLLAGFIVLTFWSNAAGYAYLRAREAADVETRREEIRYQYTSKQAATSRARAVEAEDWRRWTSEASSFESENWDAEKGRCGDAGDTCTVTLRIPAQPIWDAAVTINGTQGILDLKHPITGTIDAAFACVLANLTVREDHWITHVEALVDEFEGPDPASPAYDVTHHMDIFFCERGVTTTRQYSVSDPFTCSHDAFMASGLPLNMDEARKQQLEPLIPIVHPSCIMGPTYDRGAGDLVCPTNAAYKIGPSTATANEFILQNHYLVPKGYLDRYEPVWDTSGFKLTLERVQKATRKEEMSEEMSASSSPLRTNGPRQHSDYGNSMVEDEDERERKPLGSLGINDYGLFYPQGEKRFSHAYDIGGKDFSGSFQGDLEMFGEIQPVMVHLHAHSLTKSIWVEHLRGGRKIGEYGRIDAYEALTQHQSYFLLPEEDRQRPILPGDSVRVNCVMDTSKAEHAILYGVSHDTEMCAALILYTNHDPSSHRNYNKGNLVATCTELDICLNPPETTSKK